MNLNPKKAVFCVSAASVLRALPFAATRDVRWYLNGVCVKANPDGGALVMASNGAIGGVFKDANGRVDAARIIPLCPHLETTLRKGGSVYGTADGLVWVTDAKGETCFILPKPALEADAYPDLIGLMGDPDELGEGTSDSFNPELIEKLARGARAVRGSAVESNAVRFFHRMVDGTRGVTVAAIGDIGFALVMPLRTEGTAKEVLARALPAFALRIKANTVASIKTAPRRRKTACAA